MQQQRPPTLPELAEHVAERALEYGVRLATAESCTGGLIAHLLTRVPGVSAVYQGSIVAYSNQAKASMLEVPTAVLAHDGAVSAAAAVAMARGARSAFEADLAISTTGIAGPGGATPDKPVGLVYIGLATATNASSERYLFEGSRIENIEAATRAALILLYTSLSRPAH